MFDATLRCSLAKALVIPCVSEHVLSFEAQDELICCSGGRGQKFKSPMYRHENSHTSNYNRILRKRWLSMGGLTFT